MFKRSKFFLCVAQKMNYDDGIHFTENNIVQYLAELEEYISSLITYTAFKRDEPNAPISSIPLEKLSNKDFSKKQWNVSYLFISYFVCRSKPQSTLKLSWTLERKWRAASTERSSVQRSCTPSS